MTEREGEWEMTTFPMISYRQFDQWMEQGKIAQLVDLREPWMFEQDRIWGSVNIPYDELENLMGEIRKDGTIVFYCDRGAKSMVVCRDLWFHGHGPRALSGDGPDRRRPDIFPWQALPRPQSCL